MPLPIDFATCHISARYVDSYGQPCTGTVTFSAGVNRAVSVGTGTIVAPFHMEYSLNENGELWDGVNVGVDIPATDDPDISPTGFTYWVRENIKDAITVGRRYPIEAPAGGDFDLSSVVHLEPNTGTSVVQGPPGNPGPPGPPGLAVPAGLGAVCFQWDDGFSTFLDVADINDARGQKVTFGITTGLVGAAGYLTAAQVRALETRGHEIAAHGSQHVTGLANRTAAQRAVEYNECLDWFEANGVTRPSTWIYTFGRTAGRNDDTDRELMLRVDRVFDTEAPTSVGCAVRRDQPQFVMKRLHIESDSATAQGQAEQLIRQAAQQPVIVTFYAHGLGSGANQLSATEYAYYCDLADSLGVPVLTSRDAFPVSGNMLVDGGFEQDTVDQWVREAAAGSTAAFVTDTPVVGLAGTKSLRLESVNASYAMGFQYVACEPGRTYTLSGRYRTSAGAGNTSAEVRLRSYDHKGVALAAATSTLLAESTSWARFSMDYTAHADAVCLRADMLNQPPVTCTVWFDHVHLAPKSAGAFG